MNILLGVSSIISTGNPGNPIPRDCKEVYQRGCTQDGVYTIDPHCPNQKPFKVYCNNQYTVFQRRMDGSENFTRGWADYVLGFSSVWGEQWLGLEKIHCLTIQELPELKWELTWLISEEIRNTPTTTSLWSGMLLVSTSYKLQVTGELWETAYFMAVVYTTSMEWHSPHDRDNDLNIGGNCAQHRKGGWWYNFCMLSQLNGIYYHDTIPTGWEAVLRYTFPRHTNSLKFAEWNSELKTSQKSVTMDTLIPLHRTT